MSSYDIWLMAITAFVVAILSLATAVIYFRQFKKDNPMIFRNKMHYEVNNIEISINTVVKGDPLSYEVSFIDRRNGMPIFRKKVNKDELNDPYFITFLFLNWLEEDYKG